MESHEVASRKASLGCSSSISHRHGIIDQKQEKRQRLRAILLKLNEDNQQHEDELTAQLQENEEKLEELQEKKRLVRATFRKEVDAYDNRTAALKTSIQRKDKDLKALELKQRKIDLLMSQQRGDTMDAFNYSLKPINEAASLVQAERERVEANIQTLQAEIAELEAKLTALTKEAAHDQKKIESLQKEQLDLKEGLEEAKKKRPLEYEETIQEIEAKKKLNELKETKRKYKAELGDLDTCISDIESDLAKAISDLERGERKRTNNRRRGIDEDDLIELENYLRIRCQELDVPFIDKTVEEVSTRFSIDIEQCILKEQFKIMEGKELTIIEAAKEKQESLKHAISLETKRAEEKEQKLYASMSSPDSNPQLERTVREMSSGIKRMKKELDASQRQQAQRLKAITDWKEQHRQCLLAPDNISWPNDISIVTCMKAMIPLHVTQLSVQICPPCSSHVFS